MVLEAFMETRELICIGCPMGCQLTVNMEDADNITVTGNTCPRGEAYGKKEVTNPTRIVTSSVKINDGTIARVSVKTENDIPKGKIFDIMKEIREVTVTAPIHIGDVIIKNVADTGVDVIATKDVGRSAAI
jgi:CxxC motif-containing protein